MSDEIQPYLVYRINGDLVECTIWKLHKGDRALALFLTAESARAYQQLTRLGPEWRISRPGKEALLQLLTACCAAGVGYAVLDPDLTQARRIFDLKQVLRAAEGVTPSGT